MSTSFYQFILPISSKTNFCNPQYRILKILIFSEVFLLNKLFKSLLWISYFNVTNWEISNSNYIFLKEITILTNTFPLPIS